MGTGKTYSTKYLLDSNNNSGVAGQVLVTTAAGVNWQDAESTGDNQTQGSLFDSKIVLIDTPNGGLKPYRVITDQYGEWIQVGRFAADARTAIQQSSWSSVSGLSTGTSQNETTSFSADFGDSFPEEVRIMGATDFNDWRNTRTIDWVYKVPEGRKWKYFFSNGAENGMTPKVARTPCAADTRFGFSINGSYDGFGRWTNPGQISVGMSDYDPTNPSAAYSTPTANAFTWTAASSGDAKLTVVSDDVYSGQDCRTTAAFGTDDGVQGFFDSYPITQTSFGGGNTFSSAVWILIKLPEGASGNGFKAKYWAANGNDIYNVNSGNVGIGTDSPDAKLDVKGTGASTGLTFQTTDSSDNQNFFILDGGRTGVRYYPLTIGLASGTSAVSSARFQIATSVSGGDFVVMNDGSTGIGTQDPGAQLEIATQGTAKGLKIFQERTETATDVASIIGFYTLGLAKLRGGVDSGLYISNVTDNIVGIQGATLAEAANDLSLQPFGGNIGIGTTCPDAKLHIYGSTSLSEMYLGENAATDKAGILKYAQGDGSGTGVITLSHYGNTSTTQSLAIKYGGNVGIGTTIIPTYWSGYTVLQLGVDNSIFSNIATGSGSALFIGQNVYNDGTNYIYTGASNNEAGLVDMRSGLFKFFNAPNGTAGNVATMTQRFTIALNGNVGIGTGNDPDTKLHITGILKLVENSNTAFYGGNYVRVFGDQNYGFRNTGGTTVANISMGGNSYFNGSGNVGIGLTSPAAKLDVVGNIKTPTNDLSATADPTSFGVYTSDIRLIDTPNGGLKKCRVITDVYGEWILVGRFAASAMEKIQGVWSSESGLDTSTAQDNVTRFSADFGDSFPTEVRIMGATDFDSWRDTRTIDFVYKVPDNRKWKYFFSGGVENGMTQSTKYGWNVNGTYDGFGRWANPAQNFVRMSDGNPTNPSAAYTTATTNAFNWFTAEDAKITVSATRVFSGQDTFVTSGFGADDYRVAPPSGFQGFFDEYPSETNDMQGGIDFTSAVWVLIKLPGGSGGDGVNDWTINDAGDIVNNNNGNVGVNTTLATVASLEAAASPAASTAAAAFRTQVDTTYGNGIDSRWVSQYVSKLRVGRVNLASASSNFELAYDIAGTEIASITRNYTPSTLYFKRGSTIDVEFNGSGNVGIGVTGPSAQLEVSKSATIGAGVVTSSTTNFENVLKVKGKNNYSNGTTWFGDYGQILLSADTNMTGSARQFLITNALDNNKFAIIRSVDGNTVPVVNSTNTGVNSGTADFVIDSGGSIGIGVTSPGYKLDVDGTIRATGDVIAYSDKRVKENIKTIDNALNKVNKLRGVEFNKIGEDIKSIGVIAQEIEKVIPEVVREDDKGMKSVAYGNITGVLIEAIKELKAEIEELKKQIK